MSSTDSSSSLVMAVIVQRVPEIVMSYEKLNLIVVRGFFFIAYIESALLCIIAK